MIERDEKYPIPAGNSDPFYLGDGAYASHDGANVWVSCDRDYSFDAVCLDNFAIAMLMHYAQKIGMKVKL